MRTRIIALASLLLASMFPSGAAAQTPAAAQPAAPGAAPTPWPVHIVDCDMHPGGRSPLAVVGSLFTGGHCFREDDGNRVHWTPAEQIVMPARCIGNKYSKVMAEYLLGNVRPRPSCNEEETCVFLTSPPVNNGWDFTVDSLSLEGNTWTVTCSYWSDDIKHQWSPGSNRKGQMLRLGWLPAGDYTLRVVFNDMFMPADTDRPGVYNLRARREGKTTFTVGKGDPWNFHPWDQAPSTAIINEKDLTNVRVEPGPSQQPLYYAARRMPVENTPTTGGPKGPEDRPVVTHLCVTPALDWRKYGQSSATLWERPQVALEQGVLTASIFGGFKQTMGKYDWAEITAVEWSKQQPPPNGGAAPIPSVTIRITIWRRAFIDGGKPEKVLPAFAIPLVHEGLPAPAELVKNLKVNVEWSEGVDNPRGAVFEIRH